MRGRKATGLDVRVLEAAGLPAERGGVALSSYSVSVERILYNLAPSGRAFAARVSDELEVLVGRG